MNTSTSIDMVCCEQCFNDSVLIDIIRKGNIGECSYCESTGVHTIPVTKLKGTIEPLVQKYLPLSKIDLLKFDDREESVGSIVEQLNSDWSELIKCDNGESLLQDILGDDIDLYEELFNNDVLLETKYKKENRQRNIRKGRLWERFKNEIKSNYRYIRVDSTEINEFRNILRYMLTIIKKDTNLWRSRISDKTGFNCDEIGIPDRNKVGSGRANPKGIPYLYLSKKKVTTIYEVRAGIYDYITVGQFKVLEAIRIVNFRPVSEISPFNIDDVGFTELVEHDNFIDNFMRDLSKPNRRYDSEIEYIPTQYIIELVKNTVEIDGVEFPSSMHKNGRNIVLFTDDKVDCLDSDVVQIDDLEYDYTNI